MKHITLLILLSFMCLPLVSANASQDASKSRFSIVTPAELEEFHIAQLVLLQTQIDRLQESIHLLKTRTFNNRERFEQIGQASFNAVDQGLGESGFSVKTYYDFAAKHSAVIVQWQKENPDHVALVEQLTAEQDDLVQQLDQITRTQGAR